MYTESPLTTIFLAAILAALAFFIYYRLKGRIGFSLEKFDYFPGESVKGHITVVAKRPIKGNKLSIVLIAHSKLELRNNQGNTKTVSKKIYEHEVILENSKDYPSGYAQDYSFEIEIPNEEECNLFRSTLYHADKLLGGVFGSESKRIEWTLKARLDAKGIDLRNKEYFFVEIPGLD